MKRFAMLVAFLLAFECAQAAKLHTTPSPIVVVSSAAQAVSLSVYRDPDAARDAPMDRRWPSGYALVTETRTVELPAGDFILRFEDVAEGMFPESAIVSGLPEGVREKNRDARLLSPSGLVDAYLKRTVNITRTRLATGEERRMQARITAAPNGAVLLESSEGYEALHCTGLPERMSYAEVPANLSAKPTLSVLAHSDKPVSATVSLSYMAEGFDWQANYLATLRRHTSGAAKVDLFAWLTLANGGAQSFSEAKTVAIAGTPNRVERVDSVEAVGGALVLQCWPAQRTHDVPFNPGFLPAPPPSAMSMESYEELDSVVVTGSRIRRASSASPIAALVVEQEELGDLKLYRVPEPVTVRAKAQKQIALLVKPKTQFELYYSYEFEDWPVEAPMVLTLRTENTVKNGLGLPLPAGQVEIFEPSASGLLWVEQGWLDDHALGQTVVLPITEAPDVRIKITRVKQTRLGTDERIRWRVTLSNARDTSVRAEVKIPFSLAKSYVAVKPVDGIPTWKANIPANGETTLEFEFHRQKN